MAVGIDPKVDFAFKWLFGNERNKRLLIHLLNSVLCLSDDEKIVDVDILNPFSLKEALDDRLSILDVKARDQLGRLSNVEMQMLAHVHLPQRLLYYWATLYASQLREGHDYGELQPTFTICFLDDILFADAPDPHLTFRLLDDRQHQPFCPHLRIDVVELPKFAAPTDQVTADLDGWAYFLREAENLEPHRLPTGLRNSEVSDAMEALAMLAQTDTERELYESRLKALRDRKAQMQEMQRRGEERGEARGEARGLDRGKLIGSIQTVQRLFGFDAPAQERLEAMTTAELQQLSDQLYRQTPIVRDRGED